MKKLSFIVFLVYGISFSQNLEETIYRAAEAFIANTNDRALKQLNQQESQFKTQLQTKDEQLALVFLQCHKGYYLDKQSRLQDAITTYEDASKRFQNHELSKLSDFDIIESCLKPLGNLYTKTNNYTNAVSTINQYIFIAEQTKHIPHQISGAINLAKLHQSIGNHDTALHIIKNAYALPETNKAKQTLLQHLEITSLIALKRFNEAELLNNRLGSTTFYTHKNNYVIALQKEEFQNALTALNKAKSHLKEARLSPRKLAVFYLEEAQLYHLLKKQEPALLCLQDALKILIPQFDGNGLPNQNELYAENTFIDIFDLYARMQPDIEQALQSFDLSFYVANLLRHSWTSQETKILNETSNRNRSEACIELLLNSYKTTKNQSYLFKAFQYSENNKSTILKEIANKRERLKRFPNDSLLIGEFNLLRQQEYTTNLLIQERLHDNQTSKINELSQLLSNISLKIKTLKTAIKNKYPEDTNNDLSLENLQKKLAKDQAVLIEYFFGKHNIYQFIISPDTIKAYTIPVSQFSKKAIIDFIHLFNDAGIINNAIDHFTAQAYDLFKLLKMDHINGYKHAIVIPDGLLNFVPFEALLSNKTSSTTFSRMPFLIKTLNLAYNSSALFYLKNTNLKHDTNLLGFFPVFKNSNQSLVHSVSEADAIDNKMTATLFMHNKASKNNFIKHLENYNILHLSTHASSGDFVTPANIQFYDSTLFLNELYSLNLKAHLVVLSACETGIGKLNKGAGAMSIARGFQYAGAEQLLFSLWQINDLSTSQIMQAFYTHFNKVQSAFIANHKSKLDYLENDQISNAKKSPYYWSAFVYYGDIQPSKSKNFILYLIFGVLISVIVLLLILKLKKYDRNTSRISSEEELHQS